MAQKINTSIKHVVPKNQNFRSLLSIFQDRLSLGGKKTVINFFGLGPKKIIPRCRAHFSKHFCNSSQNSISSLSSRKIELKFFFLSDFFVDIFCDFEGRKALISTTEGGGLVY